MWSLPVGPPVVTVYFQGLLNTQVGAARYTDQLVRTTTGELIRMDNALPLLYRIHIGKELDEVKLGTDEWSILSLYNGLYNIQHGLTIRSGKESTSEGTLRWHSTRLNRSNMGQEEDLIEHAQKVGSVPPDHDLILFGFSRGATATFCAMAHYHYPRVRLVILESVIYSSTDNCQRLSFFNALRFEKLLGLFAAAHDPDGLSPASMLDSYPRVPIALIGAQLDPTVHIDGQRELARQLAARGHEVYMLILESEVHLCAVSPSFEDRRLYLIFLHALYRRLGLPHIEPFADQGEPLLEQTRVRADC